MSSRDCPDDRRLYEPQGSLAIDFVESALVGEVLLCRGSPSAEHLIDREQIHFRKDILVLFRDFRIAWTVEIAGRNLLTILAVEVFEIRLGLGARALLVDHAVDDSNRRFGKDRERRNDNVKLALAQFVDCEEGLVFPR